jgi:glycosyltransferase involved in cell wall biosynthesis
MPILTYSPSNTHPADIPLEGVSVVIPCFNEQTEILNTLRRVTTVLQGVIPFEILVVDDGSTDGTPEELESLDTDLSSTVKCIRHNQNRGYGAALKTGVRHAGFPWIMIVDSDGSYPIEEMPRMLALAGNHDMVVAARTGEDVEYSRLRKIPKFFLKGFASWVVKEQIPDLNSGMRLFQREHALRFFPILPDGFSFTTTITLALLTHHYSVAYLTVGYRKRVGKSKIRPVSDTCRFMSLIIRIGIYFAPLRVFLPFSAVFFTLFLVSLLYDLLMLKNITDKTMMVLFLGINTLFFGAIADMIDKRCS